MMKKSRIVRLKFLLSTFRTISDTFYEDRVTVYAAQASFFVIISSVPFLSLLFAIIGIFTPTDLSEFTSTVQEMLPSALHDILADLLTELRDVPSISLLSISAVTTLWSASKGISAIRGGVQTVYKAPRKRGFFKNRIYSLFYTLIFIVMIIAVVVILIFGDFLYTLITEKFHFSFGVFDDLFRFKTPIFMVFMTMIFTTMYYVIARRSECVSRKILNHVPGALFASLGWNVFSYFYSVYINHFSRASYLYGSLTAICLIMLWMYFCMIILLCGAEINKIYFANNEMSDFLQKKKISKK